MRRTGGPRPSPWRGLLVLTAIACFLPAGTGVAAQGRATASAGIEIVLDASGSMRSRYGNSDRMTVAREFVRVLRSELVRDGDGPELTLRVYGASRHRLRRDCTDTQRLIPEPASPERWAEALEAIRPMGVSPLAYALERTVLDSVPTVVLVTDGIGNCGGGACELWRRVTAVGNRRARLHVVAIDPEPDDIDGLRCLSREGSGAFVYLIEPEAPEPVARRLAMVLKNRGLVDVRLSIGGKARHVAPVRLVRPLTGEVVAGFTSRSPREVPAGVYTAIVETAPRITVPRVMVLPGDTVRIEREDLGRLTVDLRPGRGRPVRAPVSVRQADGGAELRYFLTGDTTVLLAGRYDVRVELPDSMVVRRDVEVLSGETTRVVIGGERAGTLRILAPEFQTVPPTPALLYHGGRVDTLFVGRSDSLPPGRYRLVVRTIPPYVREDVRVEPGRATTVTLPETGILGVELGGPSGPLRGVPVEIREPMTGEVYGTVPSGARRMTMPGTFRLEIASAPPEVVEEVTVGPGEERIVRRTGFATIALVEKVPEEKPPVRLEILRPGDGPRLAETTGRDPVIPALPGRYRARIWRGDDRLWEGPVVVAPGEAARIDWVGR